MKQTCILVLGMHRSGTSALTGVLQYLDIDLGSKLLGPLKENEKGFFENAYLMRFDDKLLRKINSSWDDIFFDYDEKEQLIDQSDKEELKNILKQEFGNSSLFAIKDPRICYLFPLYEKALNELGIDMKIVLPYRNPLEVAESLEKRNGFSVEKSVALWLNYFLYAEFYSRKYERFFLKFDELINHTEKSIKALSEALQIDIFERYNRHKNDVNNFLEADLKHNNIYGFNLPKGLRVTLKEIAVLYDENLNDVKQEKFDALKYSNDEYRTFYSNISKVNEELKILKDESHDLKEKNQILQEANYRLEQIDLALKNELSQIKNSRAWKFAILLRKIKQNIFGETKLLYSFIDMAKVLNISNFKKLLHHLKEGNFSLIKEKLFYTIDATSNKSLKLDIVTTKNYKNIFIPFSKNPIVTIVVPVYNQWHYTYNCIGAIVRNSGLVPYEIIVADDVSTDETVNIDKYIKNIKHIRNEKNLGFLLNCNNAAKYANGKYILFLNNDTQVQPHWLSSLVELIESDDKIGMVGSKLVYPDGRLQEAGGIVWNDASGWNYGKFDDPTKSEYNYVKEVDYISGASIMIKKTLWNEIGGFDERYVPAYYEDADLAFEVRKHCYKVMFQPKSVVVHFEGISNGTDVQSGIKKHQVENKEKFFNKWKATLKQHFKNGTNVFIARDRSMAKPHILFIDHYIPHYDQDAGSKATFQYLQMFVDSGMNVHFIGDNFYQYPDKPYFDTLTQSKMEVLHGVWYLKNWKKWLSENGRYFDYIILSRPHIAVKYIDFIKEVTNSRIIYFPVDLHYLREKRESEIKHSKKTLDDSGYMKKLELKLMKNSDISYFYSSVEVEEVFKEDSTIKTKQIPLYLYNSFKDISYKADERKDIMFIGGFAHEPNVDAVEWFTRDIWPHIQAKLPNICFYIIGSKPTDEILKLANEHIVVTGFVDDQKLEDYYSKCKLVVAPLRFGAGVKGKIIDSLYRGVPVVTTTIGAEGIQDADKIMKVSNSNSFANDVAELYENNLQLEEYSQKGLQNCKKYFSYEYAKNQLSEFMFEVNGIKE